MEVRSGWRSALPKVVGAAALFLLLYLVARRDFLLFHTFAELFSVVVMFSIFTIAWNSRRLLDNNYLMFLGIACLFMGGVDTVHVLAYPGMGVFKASNTNMSAQIWIAARYVQGASFLLAPLFLRRRLNLAAVFLGYGAVVSLLLLSIFAWAVFPTCFVDGVGLTTFKRGSEFFIAAIFALSVLLVLRKRDAFDPQVVQLLAAALLAGIPTELAFSGYRDPYGTANMLGHFLKIVSFYLIYRAVVVTAVARPQQVLFRRLMQSEEASRQSEAMLRSFFDAPGDMRGIVEVVADDDVRHIADNAVTGRFVGLRPEAMRNKLGSELGEPRDLLRTWIDRYEESRRTQEPVSFEYCDKRGDQEAWFSATVSYLGPGPGGQPRFAYVVRDVTERKRAEENMQRLAQFPEENPNPVLRTTLEGKLLYANLPARSMLAAMGTMGEGPLPQPVLTLVSQAAASERSVESEFADGQGRSWWAAAVRPAREQHVNLYLRNVTERVHAEEALREAHERARWLARFPEENLNPIVRVSPDGTVLYCNSAARSRFGWQSDKAGPLPDPVLRLLGTAMQQGARIEEEIELDEVSYAVAVTPVPAEGYANVYFRDITWRKAAEEALRRSEEELEAIFNSSPVAMVVVDAERRVVNANAAAARVSGRLAEELFGLRAGSALGCLNALTHPAGCGFGVACQSCGLRQMALDTFQTGAGRANVEVVMPLPGRQGAEERHLRISTAPIQAQASRMVLVCLEDVTDEKQAEDALRESQEDLNRAQAVGQIGSWRLDVDRNILTWSDENHRIFGIPKGTPLSYEAFLATVHPEDRAYVDRMWQAGLAGEPYDIEHRIVVGDAVKWVREKAYLEFDQEGQVLGGFGITQDITERKQAEQALRHSKNLSEALNRINQAVHSTLHSPQVIQSLVVEGAKALESDTAAVSLRQGDGWLVSHVYGMPAEMLGMRMSDEEERHALLAVESRRPVAVADAFNDERFNCQHLRRHNIRAVLVVPLVAREEVLGVLFFNYHAAPREFTEAEIAFASQLASTATAAMVNARLFEERARTEEALRRLNETLEQRVAERTAELNESLESLSKQRRRFNDVLDMLPAYVVLVSPDYRVPFANRFFEGRFGKSEGRRCYEYLFRRSEPCENCETFKVFKTNVPHHWEWTGPDGRSYDISDFPFTDVDGSPLVMEVGLDVTERKQAEAEVNAASRYARRLIEASPDPLVTIGPDGTITDVNAATETATGYTRDELIGTDFCEYFTEPVKARAGYEQVFREGSVRDYALELRHRDGHVTSVLYNASLYRDDLGKVTGVFAAARDITERKAAEQALRSSEERYRALTEQSPTFVLILQDGHVRYANPAAVEASGYTAEELRGKSILDLAHPDERARAQEVLARAMGGEPLERIGFRVVTKAGDLMWVELSATSIDYEGGPAVLLNGVDVTQQKQLEQQLVQSAKLTAIGELVSGVAHELNNPLAGVLGCAQLAQESGAAGELADYLEKIVEQSRRASAIVNNLLVFARQREPQRESVNLNDVARSALNLRAYELRVSNVKVVTELEDALPHILGDSQQLVQVLLNLIGNAEHAILSQGRAGTITIRSSTIPRSADRWARLEVLDDGPGIPEAILGRIFEPFFTTKALGEGTGLGLSVSYGIVTGHKGAISAENRPEGGARFVVELPVAEGEEQVAPPVRSRTFAAAPANILVIEDEKAVAVVLSQLLIGDGHAVTVAQEGEEALARLQKESLDLLITDMKMPGMSGLEFYRLISAEHPELARRVIFTTGDVLSGETRRFFAEVDAPVLYKPFTLEQARAIIYDKLRQVHGGPGNQTGTSSGR